MSLTVVPAIGDIYQDQQQESQQERIEQDQHKQDQHKQDQHQIKNDQHQPSEGCGGGNSGGGGDHGDQDECPGCATGCDADTAHINEKTGEYYKTCELIITYCLWCGRNAQGQDYCDTRCAIAEKRYDDIADDYY
jgi:hypothetical protein